MGYLMGYFSFKYQKDISGVIIDLLKIISGKVQLDLKSFNFGAIFVQVVL